MARSLNKVMLIGNLTRDPELKYISSGAAVVNFAVATNREWTSDGEKQEAVEYHNIVAWRKLAEICDQLLQKGSQVYLEGRLTTRSWTDDSDVKHYRTEVVLEEMLLLSRGKGGFSGDSGGSNSSSGGDSSGGGNSGGGAKKSSAKSNPVKMDDDVDLDEILADTDFDLDDSSNEDSEE
ncbi:single-stranded DNA-binding protein [candidate division WWE3 bacterium]|nr:single-stranded DNA-binding protein [candidate division WWE3 bacterium]